MGLTMSQRQAVTKTIATRYRRAGKAEKGRILDELCATTGWHRSHARKALGESLRPWVAQARRPRPLERGRGHFLATSSAAGLLTMLGSAPYAVSKHAVLAFAEWLRATYQHRGIVVQALCPQGVRTPLLQGTGVLGRALLEPDAIEVEQVVECVVEALQDGRFLVLPHPEVAGYTKAKAADPDTWLTGMNRIQRKIESGA